MNPGEPFAEASALGIISELGDTPTEDGGAETAKSAVQPHDFSNPTLLSARESRKLRRHQEEFASAFATRLSLLLRMDVTARLLGLQTIFYRKFVGSWLNPSHLTLFKTEPLRGISVLEIPPRLGAAMVDRMMGGPGVAADSTPAFTEIELALLEQAAQLILAEWCGRWRDHKELKPVILGHETNGRFVQAAPPETLMLVVQVEVRLGNCAERVQLGLPCLALEPMIRQSCQGAEVVAESAPATTAKSPLRWNSCFDEVRVPVRMEWEGLEMSARDVLALKIGDVVRLDPACAGQVRVCVADLPRFNGRPGTIAGKWAVELTRVITD